jgi:hypothetical protein
VGPDLTSARVSSWSAPSDAAVADDELAAFLQSAELATVHLYEVGASLLTSPAAVRTTAACAAHHRAHAAALATLAGPSAATGPNAALLANLAPSLQVLQSEDDELGFLFSLEGQLAGTYEWAMSRFTGAPAVQQAATILPVECQHAVELGMLLSKPVSELVGVFQADDGYLDPHEFPLP